MKSIIETFLEFVAGFFEFCAKRPKLLQSVLVFAIVVILVKVAFGFFGANRLEAQVAIARTDIIRTLSQVQAEIYSRDIMIDEGVTPLKYKTWGDFIIDIGGLDRTRWKATEFGIRAITKFKGGMLECKGDYFYIDTKEGNLIFAPSQITNEVAFCKALKDSYKNNDTKINLRAYNSHY